LFLETFIFTKIKFDGFRKKIEAGRKFSNKKTKYYASNGSIDTYDLLSLFFWNFTSPSTLACSVTPKKKPSISIDMRGFLWSHLGSNQGPPDYESGALTS
jgi:hypothetical protein